MNEEPEPYLPLDLADFDPNSAETQAEGVSTMTPNEAGDFTIKAINGYFPQINADAEGNLRLANTEHMSEEMAAYAHSLETKKQLLDKTSWTKVARKTVSKIAYDPANKGMSDSNLANLAKAELTWYGLDTQLFKEISDPAQRKAAYEALQNQVINSVLSTRASQLGTIVKNTLSNYQSANANDAIMAGRAARNTSLSKELAAVEKKYDGEEKSLKTAEIKARYKRQDEAIEAELQLRAQDELSAALLDKPDMTDYEKYAFIRDSAKRNYAEVRQMVENSPDYMGDFIKAREKNTRDQAALYAQEYDSIKSTLEANRKLGDMKGELDATTEKRNEIAQGVNASNVKANEEADYYEQHPELKEAELRRRETKKTEDAQRTAAYYEQNPDQLAAQDEAKARMKEMRDNIKAANPKVTKFVAGKSVRQMVGLYHATDEERKKNPKIDSEPALIVPPDMYEQLRKDIGAAQGEGVRVSLGGGKNAPTIPVRAGDVDIPAYSEGTFSAQYCGKRSKLTPQDLIARAQGYMQSLTFYKGGLPEGLGNQTKLPHDLSNAEGMLEKGNINPFTRKVEHRKDGSIATVESFSVNMDGKEVLLPRVIDGKTVSMDEAIKHYEQTGEHLGKFDTPAHATAYAKKFHENQAAIYSNKKNTSKKK